MISMLTENEEDRLYEALEYAIAQRDEEEKKEHPTWRSTGLIAWREILEKLRPYYRG